MDFNTGLRGSLFEARHYERMGSAVWLYAWLVLRQTHQTGQTGWVLGGAPIRYKEIQEETGFNIRTVERWMRTLRRGGYIETEAATGGVIVRITKAKKHARSPRHVTGRDGAESHRDSGNSPHTYAGTVRKSADGDTQNCAAPARELADRTHVPTQISSSSVEEFIETHKSDGIIQSQLPNPKPGLRENSDRESKRQGSVQNQRQTLNPSRSGENQKPNQTPACTRDLFSDPSRIPHVRMETPRQQWLALAEARLEQQRHRAAREESVRREIFVGVGPEVPRT